MPRRTDIKKILVIGSGPIVIGQACEFDYSGAQACKVLRDDGFEVVLVNSNPATIMTDPGLANRTYVEPITPEFVEKVIIAEKPDALLPTLGGQTGLNCAVALAEAGTLEKHGVELIGAKLDVIKKGEDRKLFAEAMERIGLDVPRGDYAYSVADGERIVVDIGLPCVVRPSFTMGGAGGGIAYNMDELREIVSQGVALSPAGEVLIEESVIGWKEYEMEVMRDVNDNAVIVCSIENVDPMGVHTGDSITVAPAQTLTDREYQTMRDASIAILREIGVETGGSNVQFAVNPANGRMTVIEMNPRVSRSSAPRLQGDRLPDREDRREARGGLHARRDRQRHHARDAGVLRAEHRLHGREGSALGVREVPRHRRDAHHPHEVGGRGHGHRPHLRRSAGQGVPLARERPRRPG